jgi:hypothetical protein
VTVFLRSLPVWVLAAVLPIAAGQADELRSPNGELAVVVDLDDDGRPGFRLFRQGEPVTRRSPLGISLEHTEFTRGLESESIEGPATVRENYTLRTGKQSSVQFEATSQRRCYSNADEQRVCLALRMADDGFAYRYEFPDESAGAVTVVAEHGGFHFFPETRAWLQPKADARSGWMNVNPAYEEDYLQDIPVGTASPMTQGWVYPALFRYGTTWLVLTEAGMDGRYPGSNLAQSSEDGLYRLRFPDGPEVVTEDGLLARSLASFHTPWRVVAFGDLATVMQSTLGTDLADGQLIDAEFVKPGIAAWSWGLLKDESVNDEVQREFIDFAASMGWQYVLVDNFWDRTIGYSKIAALAEYAAGKNVGLFLWYNSSGDWNLTVNSPKGKLLTPKQRRAEFARLQTMGIRGVKVDFFPGDGASVFRYYVDILRDAADFELMVNFHGSTLPRGLQRSFPNLVTSEAVKGEEFVTFGQDNADRQATHSAMLPFTRNLFDPMDFTPMALGDIPDIERRTSLAFELALPVLFLSGVQHLVTTPAQMQDMPEFVRDYLRLLPGAWDESRFVDGFPGQFAIIARRSGSRWFVGGINALETRRVAIDLSFTDAASAFMILDGEDDDTLVQKAIGTTVETLELEPGAGFVIVVNGRAGH